MRAVTVAAVDAPPQLTEIPRPNPGRDQILVKIEAASLNPTDYKITSGPAAEMTLRLGGAYVFPVVLGLDGAGVVTDAGPGTKRFKKGDRVFGQFRYFPLHDGTYAEYATAPESNAIVRVPDAWDTSVAAAIPTAAMTASAALDLLDLRPGERLLIIGATGGVGSFAIQMAAARKIDVIATARSGAETFVRELGASSTLDYSSQSVGGGPSSDAPEGIDALLDLVSLSPEAFMRNVEIVRPRRVAACAGTEAPVGHVDEIALRTVGFRSGPEFLNRVLSEIRDQALRVVLQRKVRLEEAVTALDNNRAGGARGKTIIII
jgi:NADPH:quinone reductase